MEPGGGGRFAKLVKELKDKKGSKGGAKSPAALAAAIGRKKYGAKKMSKFASKGKK